MEDISHDDECKVEKKKMRLHSRMNSSPSGDMDSEEEVVVICKYSVKCIVPIKVKLKIRVL